MNLAGTWSISPRFRSERGQHEPGYAHPAPQPVAQAAVVTNWRGVPA